MPTLTETEASLCYVQCFLYLASSSINVSMFYSTWMDTFWTDLSVCYSGTDCTQVQWTLLKSKFVFHEAIFVFY